MHFYATFAEVQQIVLLQILKPKCSILCVIVKGRSKIKREITKPPSQDFVSKVFQCN